MHRAASLAGLLILSVALPLRAEAPPTSVTVPFKLFPTKHIAVQIKVNGKGPYRVIFDTGAPVTLLSNKVAEETGLLDKNRPQPLFNPFGAGGEVKIKTLEVGDLKVKNVPAVVMDHPAVEAMSHAFGPVEGIVGFPFFARYKMTLDYKTQQMTFVSSDFDPPNIMEAMVALVERILEDPQPTVLAPAGVWGLQVQKRRGDTDPGVTIKEVLPDSPAAKAGLQVGDRLLTLDDRWTDTVADTFQAAEQVKPGTAITVRVRRGSKEMDVTVTPAQGL